MKTLINIALAIYIVAVASFAQAAFEGDVTGGGVFNDDVSTDNGWIIESPTGNGVDFWTFTAAANSLISIEIESEIDFGISVYQGFVDDELGFAFDNDGDFNGGTYIGGTNGFFSDGGSSLLDLVLLDGGEYTIAVGGDSGFGGFGAPYDYAMTVSVTQVPLPASALFFVSALAGLFGTRLRKFIAR